MIPPGFIQDLLSRVDVAEVVGRHVELRKAGINLKGLCPFHGEKTPSFIVSPSRQTYHCFGCGAHGDALRFLTEHVGLGFVEAVHDLAQQVGLPVPEDERTEDERADSRRLRQTQDGLAELMGRAAAHYKAQLKASPRAIDYLKGRGLTGAVAARFGLGYAPEGWRSLASAMPDYEDPRLVEAGLVIVQGEDGAEQRRYDRFRDRVMFPIRSVRGDVIGFGGRVMGDGEPKYLNSPETPIFIKGQELYGLFEARPAIRRAGYALVVEGYMDVVALAQHGIEQAVATLGTACTEDHVRKLLRFTDSIVFSFDGDAAGRKAARRAMEAALPHASDVRSFRFLFLPAEHDPDSYVREFGESGFNQAVEAALPLSAFLMDAAREGCDLATPEGRARFLTQARALWTRLPSEGLLAGQILSELARAGGADATALGATWARQTGEDRRGGRGSFGAASRAGDEGPGGAPPSFGAERKAYQPSSLAFPRPSSRPSLRPAPRQAPASPADRLVALLVANGAWWSQLDDQDRALLDTLPPAHQTLLRWLERDLEHEGERPWAAVRAGLAAEPELNSLWESVARGDEASLLQSTFTDARRVLDTLLLQALERRQTELAQRVGHEPGLIADYQALQAQWRALKARLSNPASG